MMPSILCTQGGQMGGGTVQCLHRSSNPQLENTYSSCRVMINCGVKNGVHLESPPGAGRARAPAASSSQAARRQN